MTEKIGIYKGSYKGQRRWAVRWFGRYDPATNNRKRYCKTFERQVDADNFRDKLKSEFKQGVERDPSNETLKSYAESWLIHKKNGEGIRPATALLYEGAFERLYSFFGADRLLRSITRIDAKGFIDDLKPKAERIEPLSNWMKHRILIQCKALFSEAVDDGVLSVNPFAGIKTGKGTTSEWYQLKPAEYLKLLDVTASLREKVLYALYFTTGLRETEALTLRWCDVDFDKNRIRVVNQKATDILPPFDIKDKEARTIPIPKHTINLLTSLQAEAVPGSPYILITGKRFERVCDIWRKCRETGKPWLTWYWENNILRNFNRRVKWAGIDDAGKKLSIHTLRKCCSQFWQDNFPNAVVLDWLGHSKRGTTEKFYSTVSENHFDRAVELFDNLLAAATTDVKLTKSAEKPEIQEAVSPE